MSGAFNRDRLLDWPSYADSSGMQLLGRGKWRNLLCDFHDDTEPSMRVNVESGGWICMSCGAKGGDVLDHHMQRTGVDFVAAARELGAWDEGKVRHTERKPRSLSASDAMQVVAQELLVLCIVIGDVRRGIIPSNVDWQRFLVGAGRVEALAMEFRS